MSLPFGQLVPPGYRWFLRRIRRRLYEFFGSDKFSRPSLHQIDRKLEKYLPYRNGFFVEAGANDGYTQSNTYYFEKLQGWKGILIEGVPALYEQCRTERANSIVFNCALVAANYDRPSVTMMYANLMSLVEGAQKSSTADEKHIKQGMLVQDVETYQVCVPAKTLTSLLDEVHAIEIDLLSLDVEGYELNVLKGLDLTKYRPKFILVEARFRQEIEDYLSRYGYEAIDQFSEYDVLYTRKDEALQQ